MMEKMAPGTTLYTDTGKWAILAVSPRENRPEVDGPLYIVQKCGDAYTLAWASDEEVYGKDFGEPIVRTQPETRAVFAPWEYGLWLRGWEDEEKLDHAPGTVH